MSDDIDQGPAGHSHNQPLTEYSEPGLYIVITASGTIYRIEIVSPDDPATIIRFPIVESLLRDGTWLPNIHGFHFDADTGLGEIRWWKDNPNDYDRPDLPYIGTVRTTTRVHVIARIEARTPSPPDHTSEQGEPSSARDDVIDLLRQTLAGIATHEQLATFIDLLIAPRKSEP